MADTLLKLEYTNLIQFLEDLNRNFAVVQNSPLFKGVVGKSASDGATGASGIRGTRFMFVSATLFSQAFSTNLLGSQIDNAFLNAKLLTESDRAKLLIALNDTAFVHGDIVVLTNSQMLSFDGVSAQENFVDTGLAFNQENNIASSLDKKVGEIVTNYLDNWSSQQATNIFESLPTVAKNNLNVTTSTQLYDSSVFLPIYTGKVTDAGYKVLNHKYFGFTKYDVPSDSSETMVFGSIEKYIDLLIATTDGTGVDGGLSSDYAPGNGNLPNAIFLQETSKNGLLIGLKSSSNLRQFASIFKRDVNTLVIRSDQGTNVSEYSELLLRKGYMEYAKKFILGGDLVASGNISNTFIRTGTYLGLNNTNNMELGSVAPSAKTTHISDLQVFKKYANNVLVTDVDGNILKTYSLENTTIDESKKEFLNKFMSTNVPSSALKFITSDYFKFLCEKFDKTTDYIGENYYKITEFSDGSIKYQKIDGNFDVVGNTTLGAKNGSIGLVHVSPSLNTTRLGKDDSSTTNIKGNIYTDKLSKVLVTNASGKVSDDCALSDNNDSQFTDYYSMPFENIPYELIPDSFDATENKILNGLQFKVLLKLINQIKIRFLNTLSKNETRNLINLPIIQQYAGFDKPVIISGFKVVEKNVDGINTRYQLSDGIIYYNGFCGNIYGGIYNPIVDNSLGYNRHIQYLKYESTNNYFYLHNTPEESGDLSGNNVIIFDYPIENRRHNEGVVPDYEEILNTTGYGGAIISTRIYRVYGNNLVIKGEYFSVSGVGQESVYESVSFLRPLVNKTYTKFNLFNIDASLNLTFASMKLVDNQVRNIQTLVSGTHYEVDVNLKLNVW